MKLGFRQQLPVRRYAWVLPAGTLRCRLPASWQASSQAGCATLDDIQQLAIGRSLDLQISTLGPAYEVICRDGLGGGPILGTSSGIALAPLGILHCDKMEIFARSSHGSEGQRIRGGILGLGWLIAMAVFAHGLANGCHKAEILAINDDDRWHQRLVRYYSRMYGFYVVKEVTGKLSDLPDMLVWGGIGTRMDADLEKELRRWTPAILQHLTPNSSGRT